MIAHMIVTKAKKQFCYGYLLESFAAIVIIIKIEFHANI